MAVAVSGVLAVAVAASGGLAVARVLAVAAGIAVAAPGGLAVAAAVAVAGVVAVSGGLAVVAVAARVLAVAVGRPVAVVLAVGGVLAVVRVLAVSGGLAAVVRVLAVAGGGVVVGVQGQPQAGEVVQGCRSSCPVTTGVSIASHAAAWAAAPVRCTVPGPAAARAGVQDRSAAEGPRRSCQVDVHDQVRGLAVPAGDQLPADQPPAGFLDRVMAALGGGAGIFRPGLLPERVQHHAEGGGAAGGQVPLQPPGAAERGAQPHRPLLEPVLAGVRAGAGAFEHFPGQPGQVMLIRAAQHRGQQDAVRVRPQIFGELIGPVADQPGQRDRQLPGGQRGGDHRVGGQPPRPPGRGPGGGAGDAGDRAQPGGGAVLAVGLIPVLGGERGKDRRPGGGVLGFGGFQPGQRRGLRGGAQAAASQLAR